MAIAYLYENRYISQCDLAENSPLTPRYIKAKKLRGVDFIVCSPELGIGSVTRELFHRHRLDPHIVMSVQSNEAAFRIASAGLGMVFVPARTPLWINLVREMDSALHPPVCRLIF